MGCVTVAMGSGFNRLSGLAATVRDEFDLQIETKAFNLTTSDGTKVAEDSVVGHDGRFHLLSECLGIDCTIDQCSNP